jgi:hypothetical protein
MLEMASALGVEVVVEGVETELQRDFLAASGVDLHAQGWFFSRALAANALYLFVAKNKVVLESVISHREDGSSSPEISTPIQFVPRVTVSDLPDEWSGSSPRPIVPVSGD